MSDQEKIQSVFSQINILESYDEALNARLAIISDAINESRMALEAIQALPNEGSAELMVPIGGGLNLPVTHDTAKKIVVRVGDNVTVEKSRDESVEFLNRRLEEFQKGYLETQRTEVQIKNNLNSLRDQLNVLANRK